MNYCLHKKCVHLASTCPSLWFSGLTDSAEMCLLSPFSTQNEADLSLPLLISSSPGPNKSCCFQREPPEGCEKVRVWEETRYMTLVRLVPLH